MGRRKRAVAPHAVVTAAGSPPDRRSLLDRVQAAMGHRRFRSSRVDRNRGRGIVVLVAVVAGLVIAMSVISGTDTHRLSSTAAIQISRSTFFGGSGYDQSPAGNTIYYTYIANGATFSGVDFRRWIDVAKHRPKVCFDPADPSSHLLVEGSFQCGVGR